MGEGWEQKVGREKEEERALPQMAKPNELVEEGSGGMTTGMRQAGILLLFLLA